MQLGIRAVNTTIRLYIASRTDQGCTDQDLLQVQFTQWTQPCKANPCYISILLSDQDRIRKKLFDLE